VWLRELLSQTLATQIAVLPLLIYMSGSVSLLSIPANIMILPTVPFAMMGSFVSGLLGFIGQTIALPFSLATSAFLSYSIFTAKFFAGLPFSAVTVPAGIGSLTALILILGIVFALLKKKVPVDKISL
jgi:competence protein ComEC